MSSNEGSNEGAAAQKTVEMTRVEHQISKRAALNFMDRDVWGPREKSMGNPWSPTNPDGTSVLTISWALYISLTIHLLFKCYSSLG